MKNRIAKLNPPMRRYPDRAPVMDVAYSSFGLRRLRSSPARLPPLVEGMEGGGGVADCGAGFGCAGGGVAGMGGDFGAGLVGAGGGADGLAAGGGVACTDAGSASLLIVCRVRALASFSDCI